MINLRLKAKEGQNIPRNFAWLIGEGYFKPIYSPDGQKLLIAKNQRQVKENTWINSIYVLDIKSGKTKKIGNGSTYLWRPVLNPEN